MHYKLVSTVILLFSTSLFAQHQLILSKFFQVDENHKVHCFVSGNPSGIPTMFLHGGPGGFFKRKSCKLFNPNKYYVFLCDQRGAGKSRSNDILKNNTTSDLIHDIEWIRKYHNFNKLYIVGESWGTTLALLYAEKYPQNVSGLLLQGTFLARQEDLHYALNNGPSEYIKTLKEIVPNADLPSLWSIYAQKLSSGNPPEIQYDAAKRLALWSIGSSLLSPPPIEQAEKRLIKEMSREEIISMAKIIAHYASNDFFIEADQILTNIDQIKDIPTMILHGEYDKMCPVSGAQKLHSLLNLRRLHVVPGAGHGYMDNRMIRVFQYFINSFM